MKPIALAIYILLMGGCKERIAREKAIEALERANQELTYGSYDSFRKYDRIYDTLSKVADSIHNAKLKEEFNKKYR